MKTWYLILAQFVFGFTVIAIIDAGRFYSYMTDKHFSCCSWYEEDYLHYPITNIALMFGEEEYSFTINASKSEFWITKDVCFETKCFWTITSKLRLK